MIYTLTYSPVFKITLKRLCSFLSRKYSPTLALETKALIQKSLSEKLPPNPLMGPLCDRLIEIGAGSYRQLIIDQHNIVIYRVDEQNMELKVLLVFDSRQSLEKLLGEVNLAI